jgi:hypothetical protein
VVVLDECATNVRISCDIYTDWSFCPLVASHVLIRAEVCERGSGRLRGKCGV